MTLELIVKIETISVTVVKIKTSLGVSIPENQSEIHAKNTVNPNIVRRILGVNIMLPSSFTLTDANEIPKRSKRTATAFMIIRI
jgi:hypothetical protein